MLKTLDGRNRAIVIAASLARVIPAIRIASVRWRSYLPENTEISPDSPCVRCAAIWIARFAFIRLTFVPHGIAEWLARVDRVRWTLAIDDWRFCPSKLKTFMLLFSVPEDVTYTKPGAGVGQCIWPSAEKTCPGGTLVALKRCDL